MNRDYIIGFLDGEGCFSISDCKNYINFHISTAQRTDNGKVLFLIQKELNGIGGIYKYKPKNYDVYNRNESNQYHIYSKDDVQHFIDYIGDNDFIVKNEEYGVFKEGFEYYKKHSNGSGRGKHTNTNLYNNMIKYRLELQHLKKFGVDKSIEIEVYVHQNNIDDWI